MTGARCVVETPIGPLVLSTDSSGALTGVRFPDHRRPGGAGPHRRGGPDGVRGAGGAGSVGRRARLGLDTAAAQLHEYFSGRRRSFTVPLALDGTPFQRQVWEHLQRVRYGTTVSYAELARRVGRPGGARAVGHANARNPVAVIVPCHRVVGTDGTLTGYGGGLTAKRWLLEIEASTPGGA